MRKLIKKSFSKKKHISDLTIERLILYSKFLTDLKNSKVEKILSAEIARHFNIDAAQVRKDLSFIGKLGKRGSGYNVEKLLSVLNKFLYINKKVNAAIIGVGNLGSALLGYKIFSKSNINIICGFDVDEKIIGKKVHNVDVFDVKMLEDVVCKNNIDIGVITTPTSEANKMAEKLQKAGVKGIINFAPTHIVCYKDIDVHNVDISIFFDTIRYNIFKNNA